MSLEYRKCLKCGNDMRASALSGYWHCKNCLMFLDIREMSGDEIVRYSLREGLFYDIIYDTIEVPRGSLLIVNNY